MPWILGTITLCLSATLAFGEETLPGQVDFGTFSPPKGDGQFVEVNVPTELIVLARHFVEKEEPDVAQVLDGLKLVHVNVIGLDKDNRAEMTERAKKVRAQLAERGWQRIVTAQEKGKDVSVYLKMGDQSVIQGIVAVVIDGDQHAVFANVVGDIKPEQLTMLGDKFDIDPLKNLGIKDKMKDKDKDEAKDDDSDKAKEKDKAKSDQ